MPVFDYFCQACGNHFEQRSTSTEVQEFGECPNCGGKARRKFTAPAIIFKGSGFYKTDNRAISKSASG